LVPHLFYFYTPTQSSFTVFTVKSISSFVLYLLKEKRTDGRVGLQSNAFNTWLPISEPELHALPPDAEIPAMSKLNKSMSAICVQGKETFNTVYNELSASILPLKQTSGIAFDSSTFI